MSIKKEAKGELNLTFREMRAMTDVEDAEIDAVHPSNQLFPGAERVGDSSSVDWEDQANSSDDDNNSITEPSALPEKIIEATAVIDDHENEQQQQGDDRERERLRDEIRMVLQQTTTTPPPPLLVQADVVVGTPHKHNNIQPSANQETICFGLFPCQRNWVYFGMAIILMVVVVIIAVSVSVSVIRSTNTTVAPSTTAIPTSPPTQQLPLLCPTTTAVSLPDQTLFCQSSCVNFSGIPVTANGLDFKGVIKDYLIDPWSSPHGSKINCWDVSQVTDMSFAFAYNISSIVGYDDPSLEDISFSSFNEPLNCWNVSKVTTMKYMFYHTETFNEDIGYWDVSSVADMSLMFEGASNFNKDIGPWDVSSVTDMSGMFKLTNTFDQDIGSWDISSVTSLSSMFAFAKAFNQDIGCWNVTGVKDMSYMFLDANIFNQDLCVWREKMNVYHVETFSMFVYSGCEDHTDPMSDSSNWCQVCTDT